MGIFDEFFLRDALANALGTLIAAVVTGVVIYIIINPFRRWLNLHNPELGNILQILLSWIMFPYLRLSLFIISLLFLYLQEPYKSIWFVLSLITFLSFFRREKNLYPLSSPSSIFSDDFQNSKNQVSDSRWEIKTGSPSIEPLDMGHARLRLALATPQQATNSFLVAKNIGLERGIVECEVYLSPGSVFNIVFFCNEENDNWHMARFDARQTESDAFLIKDQGKGVNWRFNKQWGIRTNDNQWHRLRLEFNSEKARMFRNGDLLGEITNPQIFGKKIGMFNECGEVLVSNFTISKA